MIFFCMILTALFCWPVSPEGEMHTPPAPPRVIVPCIQELEAFMRPFGTRVSIYYRNLETGFTFRHQAGWGRFGASVAKAPFALYLFEHAERGEICLYEELIFTAADSFGGAGVIRHRYPRGTAFTVGALIHKNLVYSDNIATVMLRRRFGYEGYRQFVNNLGAQGHRVMYNIFNSMMSADDGGIFAQAIHDFITSDAAGAAQLRYSMLNNPAPFIPTPYPLASKCGWVATTRNCLAIIYAPSPFILVVLTNPTGDAERDARDFAEISRHFHEFNARYFQN